MSSATACPYAAQASAEQLKSLREKRPDTIEIVALPSVAASLEPDIVDWLNFCCLASRRRPQKSDGLRHFRSETETEIWPEK